MSQRIDIVDAIDYVTFCRKYASKNKPVLLAEGSFDCRALGKWTFDFFADLYGDRMVSVVGVHRAPEQMELRKYLKDIGEPDSPRNYLRDLQLNSLDPALLNDLPQIDAFPEDILRHTIATKDMMKWLYIGPKQTGTSLHVDVWQSESWMLLVSGRKRWTMYPPGTFERLGKSSSDVIADNDIIVSKARDPIEFELNPGQIVYVPSGWWHSVRNLEASIAVTSNFINSYSVEGAYVSGATQTAILNRALNEEVKIVGELLSTGAGDTRKNAVRAVALIEALELRARTLNEESDSLLKRSSQIRELLAAERNNLEISPTKPVD